jgi:lipopolysaccharide/colanic/teichoic acid biosynthesis glycosyltransferase
MKFRLFDLFLSIPFALLFFIPLVILCLLKWLEDRKNPIYSAVRVTKDGKVFSMYKIRTMILDAEKLGGSSTANSDSRITPFGKFLRKYKLDEIPQLINVIAGDLSLVGVRPTTTEEYASFTDYEKKAFSRNAGLSDLSSIFFSDEGALLNNAKDPDALYQEVIRPKKSKLGVLYAEKSSLILNVQIIFITLINFLNRRIALKLFLLALMRINAAQDIQEFVNEKLHKFYYEKSV